MTHQVIGYVYEWFEHKNTEDDSTELCGWTLGPSKPDI